MDEDIAKELATDILDWLKDNTDELKFCHEEFAVEDLVFIIMGYVDK